MAGKWATGWGTNQPNYVPHDTRNVTPDPTIHLIFCFEHVFERHHETLHAAICLKRTLHNNELKTTWNQLNSLSKGVGFVWFRIEATGTCPKQKWSNHLRLNIDRWNNMPIPWGMPKPWHSGKIIVTILVGALHEPSWCTVTLFWQDQTYTTNVGS